MLVCLSVGRSVSVNYLEKYSYDFPEILQGASDRHSETSEPKKKYPLHARLGAISVLSLYGELCKKNVKIHRF